MKARDYIVIVIALAWIALVFATGFELWTLIPGMFLMVLLLWWWDKCWQEKYDEYKRKK